MLYRATFAWNAALGRLKYLAGFPALAAVSHLRARSAPGAEPIASQESRSIRDAE